MSNDIKKRREQFARAALTGLLSGSAAERQLARLSGDEDFNGDTPQEFARRAFRMADAMLAEQERVPNSDFMALVEALMAYRHAQRNMLEKWAAGDEQVKGDAWRALHECAGAADLILEKLGL